MNVHVGHPAACCTTRMHVGHGVSVIAPLPPSVFNELNLPGFRKFSQVSVYGAQADLRHVTNYCLMNFFSGGMTGDTAEIAQNQLSLPGFSCGLFHCVWPVEFRPVFY